LICLHPTRRWRQLGRCGSLLLIFLAGIGWAQSANPAAASKQESRVETSDADKIKSTTQSLKRMRDVLGEVFTKLKEARDSNDVVKAACVNEKLTQIKALLRISEQAHVEMQDAMSTGITSRAEDAYTKLTIAPGKVEGLRAAAEECMGQLAFQTVFTRTEVEIPSGLPQTDLTNPPPPYKVIVHPPPASPTL
jgi:hypothetical protein